MFFTAPLQRCGACWLASAALCLVPGVICALSATEGWGEVTSIAFLPDGKTVVAACQDDDKLHIYDVASGKERDKVEAHKSGCWCVAISPDGKHVATGGGDNLVRLWDAATFKEIRSFTGHTKEVLAVTFSPDGTKLASGGADRSIRTWDVATAKELKVWHGHELKVLSLSYSGDGKMLASAGVASVAIPGFVQGGTHADMVRLWDGQTGKQIRQYALRATTVCITPDSRALAAAGYSVIGTPQEGGFVTVSRGTKAMLGAVAKDEEWVAMKGMGSGLAMSPDGRLLALALGSRLHMVKGKGKFGFGTVDDDIDNHGVTIWEIATGKQVMQLQANSATVLAFSPDGKTLATGTTGGEVRFSSLAPEGWPKNSKSTQPDAADLDKLWASLAKEDPVAAYAAIWTLSAAGKLAIAFLKDKLAPEQPAGDKGKDLLTKMDSDKYTVREAAFRDLKKLGPAIEAELRQAAAGEQTSAEVRKRLATVLASLDKRPASPGELRQVRSIQILERMDSSDARQVLAALAKGAPGAWLTEQARLAVKRLEVGPR